MLLLSVALKYDRLISNSDAEACVNFLDDTTILNIPSSDAVIPWGIVVNVLPLKKQGLFVFHLISLQN